MIADKEYLPLAWTLLFEVVGKTAPCVALFVLNTERHTSELQG